MTIRGWFPLRLTDLIFLQSKGLSGVSSSIIVQRHQFFSTPSSLQSSSHNHTWPLGNHQFSSFAQSCPILCDPMNHSTPGPPVHHQLLEFTEPMSIDLVMPSNHLILCCPLLLLPTIFSSIRIFSNESALCIRWPKYWSFSLASVLPMNIQGWFPLGWTGWISLQSKGLSRVFSNVTVQKHQFFSTQLSL